MLPQFILLLDADIWDGVSFPNPTTYVIEKEIIFMANFDPTYVCLARVNESNVLPVISSLELRPLNQSMYWPADQANSLLRLEYSNFGAQVLDKDVRYPDDPFDRLWSPSPVDFPNITTGMKVSMGVANDQPPSLVMRTAETSYPSTTRVMNLPYRYSSRNGNLYISMYFAEVQPDLSATEVREFDLYLDGNKLNDDPIQPMYLQSSNISVLIPYGITNTMAFSLQATNRSTLSPLTSALESYRQKAHHQEGTFTSDVEALSIIQQQINYTYTGDPCLPLQYFWDWLTCNDDVSPRIVTLNLSKKDLTGSIPAEISRLTALEIIDLSDNSLNGTIPESLVSLKNLKKLDLENNDLTGTVPAALKSNKNLTLSLSGNAHLCYEGHDYCRKKSTSKGMIIGLAVVGFCILIGVSAIFYKINSIRMALLYMRRNYRSSKATESLVSPIPRPQVVIEPNCRVYSYEEVREMTGEFSRQIGRGGYGPVFYGRLENRRELAVKISLATSNQGTHEFTTEVVFLSRVHHKNLVSLLGYFCEGEHRILIYEFMHRGSFNGLLHGTSLSKRDLYWEKRLDITLNAAQGLEYLHSGCNPPIIHRDIKSDNILLSETMEAKIADFGMSKNGPASEKTHVSTNVKGTFGYLDPQYANTGQLTEKSDVYSFGIIILEIVSGQKPFYMNSSNEMINILCSSRLTICEGDTEKLIDQDAVDNLHLGAMCKLGELIMACTEEENNDRPNMSHVVGELKETLKLQKTIRRGENELVDHTNCTPINVQFSVATVDSSVLSSR